VIVQVSEFVRFTDASRIVIALQRPSADRSVIALAVQMVGPAAALQVFDAPATPTRAWRCASDSSGAAYWYRMGARGGITEIHVASAAPISGSAIAAEVAGLSPGAAVQALCDLLAAQ
jgi:hypothetical protein